MRLVLLFGAGWLAVLVAVGLWVGLPAHGVSVRVATETRLVPPVPPPRAGARFPGGTVTRAYSAHQMMVIEVETDSSVSPAQIAIQMVAPLKDRYDEVLIYVRVAGAPVADLPVRRIQWTRRGGYAEMAYEP